MFLYDLLQFLKRDLASIYTDELDITALG